MGVIQAGNQDESSEDGERIWGALDALLRTFLKTHFMVPAEKGDRRRQIERGRQREWDGSAGDAGEQKAKTRLSRHHEEPGGQRVLLSYWSSTQSTMGLGQGTGARDWGKGQGHTQALQPPLSLQTNLKNNVTCGNGEKTSPSSRKALILMNVIRVMTKMILRSVLALAFYDSVLWTTVILIP